MMKVMPTRLGRIGRISARGLAHRAYDATPLLPHVAMNKAATLYVTVLSTHPVSVERMTRTMIFTVPARFSTPLSKHGLVLRRAAQARTPGNYLTRHAMPPAIMPRR